MEPAAERINQKHGLTKQIKMKQEFNFRTWDKKKNYVKNSNKREGNKS